MGTLSLIISIIALIIALAALARARPAPAPQPARPPQTPRTATDSPPPEILAVIAAAVSMVCGPNARIAGVQPAVATTGAGVESTAHPWALEGRLALHTTHRPR